MENFDPEVHIATTGTGIVPFFRSRTPEKESDVELRGGHAYSISKVDSKNERIILVNPYNTSRQMELTFSQFKRRFTLLFIARIDNAKLLKNMEHLGEEKS